MGDIPTKWLQLEPPAWGHAPFGHPTTGTLPDTGESVKIIRIHDRGFGLPKTQWTNYDEN